MLPNSIHNQDLEEKSEGQALEGRKLKGQGPTAKDPKAKDLKVKGWKENKSVGNVAQRNVSDALMAMFQRLALSEDQKALALEYHRLSMQPTLCDQDPSFLISVWEKAQDDDRLAEALSFVDGLMPHSLEGQALISQDFDVRTYLSEHVVVLAEEKLKERRGEHAHLSANSSYVTMVCPDGSGIVNKWINRGSYLRLDDSKLSDGVCDRCHAKLSEHVRFIGADNISGARDGNRSRDDRLLADNETREDKETMPG